MRHVTKSRTGGRWPVARDYSAGSGISIDERPFDVSRLSDIAFRSTRNQLPIASGAARTIDNRTYAHTGITSRPVLMFDNNLVHKGTPPREGFRQLAQVEIYPSMTKLTEEQVHLSLTNPLVHDYPHDPRVNDLSGAQLVNA